MLALTLLPLDLLRQLPVRDDPSLLHALLVDVLGVGMATVGQLALIGYLAIAAGRSMPRNVAAVGRWVPQGLAVALSALRSDPGTLIGGLVLAGAVSAVLTVPASVLALGAGQVIGPLQDPPLSRLLAAGLSDALATAVTAPWFACLAVNLSQRQPPAGPSAHLGT